MSTQILVTPPRRDPARRRAWLVTAAVALLVLTYLVVWSTYASTHMVTRYRVLDAGAAGTRLDGEYRLLSLVRSDRLATDDGGEPQIADAGTTFVVAQVELVQRRPNELFLCTVNLLGPDRRVWESSYPDVSRPSAACSEDLAVPGRAFRYETVFVVPDIDADALVGVVLLDNSSGARTQVLRPPA